jgi:hypothetical protein
MKLVRDALNDINVSKPTQDLQEDIIRKLQDLIDAFKRKFKASKRKGGGGGGGGKPPLVPDPYQIEMIRKLQEHILKKTIYLRRKLNMDAKDISALERRVLENLTDQEEKLADITDKFIKKFERQVEEEEGR